MIKRIGRALIRRSRLAFALRNHADMLPALLAGQEGRTKRSWSRHGEDERLVSELRDVLQTGYYLDVGANHPVALSNTYRLYAMGMRGITIEPHEILSNLHVRYRPGDTALCCAVSDHDGLARFYEMSYHALSTFSKEDRDRRVADGVKVVRECYRPMFRLDTILRDCAPADRPIFALLSVDVEGMDEIVLRSNDWTRHRPRLIVVEQNDEGSAQRVRAYLEELGYEATGQFGVNGLFRDKLTANRANVPETMTPRPISA